MKFTLISKKEVVKLKEMNTDARELIRSYIDNIEEYMKSTCKMHPNEIDTLLTEINDFMYIRSNELATEVTITHSNVLQAMEECGSPSEICDQYLESDDEEVDLTTTIPLKQKENQKFKGITHKKAFSTPRISASYLSQLRRNKIFAFFRIISAFIYISAIIMVVIRPFGYMGQTTFSYGNIQYLIEEYLSISILWFLVFLFFEGWLILKWKRRMAIREFSRVSDDTVIITIARIGFLILLLKGSLLPLPWEAIIAVPILIAGELLLERQLKSQLWIQTISPSLIALANSIENNEIISDMNNKLNKWSGTFQDYSTGERLTLLLSGIFLLISFFFAWGYGWGEIIFISEFYYFETERLLPVLSIHLLLASGILIALIVISFSSEDEINGSSFKLNSSSFWIGRLLGIRSLMMLVAYSYDYFWDYFGSYGVFLSLLLPCTYLIFEITVGFQRHLALKRSIISGLHYLGRDSVSPSSHLEIQKSTASKSPSRAEIKSTSTQISPQSSVIQNSRSHIHPGDVSGDSRSQKNGSGLFQLISTLWTLLYLILSPIFSFLSAVFISFTLLSGLVYEILLFVLILLTGLSIDGSYNIPIYSISAVNDSSIVYQIGGFTIWSGHLVAALGLQIFILVVIQWFQFIRKKPEGIIMVFFVNVSRILLFCLFLGSITKNFSGDIYATINIVIVLILAIYMELSSLKIRLERKKWRNESMSLLQNTVANNQPGTKVTNPINSGKNSI